MEIQWYDEVDFIPFKLIEIKTISSYFTNFFFSMSNNND